KIFGALLHDTACPTGLAAGQKENVIPSEAEAILDCRILPGSSLETLTGEIRAAVREEVDFEVIQATSPVVHDDRTPLFDLIADVVHQRDPGCHVVPSLIVGYTDGANYHRLGYTTYGFAPIQLPKELVFTDMYHGHDERIPLEGFFWGLQTFFEVVRRFCS
ncbi:MAG: peptidase dimerization domain-containing protein, partial [Cyanobacteria bacterium REEB65]|nr:peptidase dimerization domain-containing protein [Cyanobacteria bacterium REEB65]